MSTPSSVPPPYQFQLSSKPQPDLGTEGLALGCTVEGLHVLEVWRLQGWDSLFLSLCMASGPVHRIKSTGQSLGVCPEVHWASLPLVRGRLKEGAPPSPVLGERIVGVSVTP
jgi:hypothetical protein